MIGQNQVRLAWERRSLPTGQEEVISSIIEATTNCLRPSCAHCHKVGALDPNPGGMEDVTNLKITLWNTQGTAHLYRKHALLAFLKEREPDILIIPESKIDSQGIDSLPHLTHLLHLHRYCYRYWNSCAWNRGLHGLGVLSRYAPLTVKYGIGESQIDSEGRVVTLEFSNLVVIGSYAPSSGQEFENQYKRCQYEKAMTAHIKRMKATTGKPVILATDANVTLRDIDAHDGKTNAKYRATQCSSSTRERKAAEKLLTDTGLVDAYAAL